MGLAMKKAAMNAAIFIDMGAMRPVLGKEKSR